MAPAEARRPEALSRSRDCSLGHGWEPDRREPGTGTPRDALFPVPGSLFPFFSISPFPALPILNSGSSKLSARSRAASRAYAAARASTALITPSPPFASRPPVSQEAKPESRFENIDNRLGRSGSSGGRSSTSGMSSTRPRPSPSHAMCTRAVVRRSCSTSAPSTSARRMKIPPGLSARCVSLDPITVASSWSASSCWYDGGLVMRKTMSTVIPLRRQ